MRKPPPTFLSIKDWIGWGVCVCAHVCVHFKSFAWMFRREKSHKCSEQFTLWSDVCFQPV